MISTTVLGTPLISAVLQDPPVSANKTVVDLFGYSTHIAILNPVMRVGALNYEGEMLSL